MGVMQCSWPCWKGPCPRISASDRWVDTFSTPKEKPLTFARKIRGLFGPGSFEHDIQGADFKRISVFKNFQGYRQGYRMPLAGTC